MPDLKDLKGVSEQDRRMIADAEALLGPEPSKMGFVKNLFWGNVRQDLVFPYPQPSAEEKARCDALLAKLDEYLRTEHPAQLIDQEQYVPDWAIRKLFDLGVMGMNIPAEYGGGGFGVTSYNRALEMIGRYCGSTAVLVSAHQSIGCKAVVLFGNEEQKRRWLPKLASEWVSAFCLSEPNVGCDAGGQETRCELSSNGQHYILNGEKKWATSAAFSQVFTVMAKQRMPDGKDKVTALVCTPDLPGIEIFQKNRSKCGIRGTWQARIRFKDVRVPVANRLGAEGKGLNIALTCLNYGRCTLSAGMLGGAQYAFEQGTKWAQTRYQFQRPLAEFELVQQRIARMSALCYAIDAVLYMTTGFLDRHDEDIMVETALCKVFCSEMGWRVVNDCVQIMGGEGYMTENGVERIFRDSRINLIVEGANEVMQSFIFAYGGKQLAEHMLGVRAATGYDEDASLWRNFASAMKSATRPAVMKAATPLVGELYLGIRRGSADIDRVHHSLHDVTRRLTKLVREHSHQFKLASKRHGDKIVAREAVQARISDSAMWLHAWVCTLSKLDRQMRSGESGVKFDRDRAAAMHFFDIAEEAIHNAFHELADDSDDSMRTAAAAALRFSDTLPNSDYAIHESSPNARGTGKVLRQDAIKQFPGGDRQPYVAPAERNGQSNGETYATGTTATDARVSANNPTVSAPRG